jgi:transcriptional regulator with XRE-family HTH domain
VSTSDDPSSFATRLRTERKRLRLTQSEVADKAGINRRTQVAYENTERTPTLDYLPVLASMGFDVAFVLYGVREARHASRSFNWKLLSEIHSAIRSWCDGKNIELTPQEEIELARALYDQFAFEGQVEPEAVERMLTLLTHPSNGFTQDI